MARIKYRMIWTLFLLITISTFITYMTILRPNHIHSSCINDNNGKIQEMMDLKQQLNKYRQEIDELKANINLKSINSRKWTYALMIVKCNDLLQALTLVYNIQTVDKNQNI
eukprot:85410_1